MNPMIDFAAVAAESAAAAVVETEAVAGVVTVREVVDGLDRSQGREVGVDFAVRMSQRGEIHREDNPLEVHGQVGAYLRA